MSERKVKQQKNRKEGKKQEAPKKKQQKNRKRGKKRQRSERKQKMV